MVITRGVRERESPKIELEGRGSAVLVITRGYGAGITKNKDWRERERGFWYMGLGITKIEHGRGTCSRILKMNIENLSDRC